MNLDWEAPPEERLFQAALAHAPEEREAFVHQAAGDNADLLQGVLALLKGWKESGGDSAQATLGEASSARHAWAAQTEEPGQIIDHFQLVRIIGEGGMGTVWQARQSQPVERDVALKVIKVGMDTREVIARFERERQTLALMSHPYIAQVYEAGSTALGRPYFAMELALGVSLTTYCNEGDLPIKERIRLFIDVCEAVEHAHQKGIIHRDLKPSNILVSEGLIKIIDFGVAKATHRTEAKDSLYTRDSQMLGTPAYMSPEQASSDGADIDTRTDVYSLEVVLYELLCRCLPFDPDRLAKMSIAELQRLITEEDPPRPSTRLTRTRAERTTDSPPVTLPVGNVDRDLDWIVMKTLSKERERRYASAAALGEDLKRYLNGDAVLAAPPSKAYRLRKFVRKHRVPVAALTVIFGALMAGLVVSAIQIRRTNHALAGETAARLDATRTVASLYAQNGFGAESPTEAALWFAKAAVTAQADPDLSSTNRLRALTWRRESRTAVRAFHTGFQFIRNLAWHPKDRSLIVLSELSPEAQVWDLNLEQQWHPDSREAFCRAYWSPSGRYVLGCGKSQTTVFAYPSGEALATIEVGTPEAEWGPNEKLIAICSSQGLVWDWQNDAQWTLPVAEGDWPRGIHFNATGEALIFRLKETTHVCSAAKPSRPLHAPIPVVRSLESNFLPDGKHYYTCSEDSTLVIRDTQTGDVVESFPDRHLEATRDIRITADGEWIAQINLPLLHRPTGKAATFPKHDTLFHTLSFRADGKVIATGSYAPDIRLWSIPHGEFLGTVGHANNPIVDLCFSPDGTLIASAERGYVRVWRADLGESTRNLGLAGPSLATLSADGNLLAPSGFTNRGSRLSEARLYDALSGEAVGPELDIGGILMDATFTVGEQGHLVLAVSTTPDRAHIDMTTNPGSGNVQFWDAVKGVRLGEPIAMPSEPRGVAIHPSGEFIAVCCAGGEGLEIRKADRTTELIIQQTRDKHPSHAATLNNGRCRYSPDGRTLAIWGLSKHFHLWDREASQSLIEPFRDHATVHALNFRNGYVANTSVATPSVIEIRDWRTGTEAIETPMAYDHWPVVVRFSEDGELLLGAGGDKMARVWDWHDGTLMGPPFSHEDGVFAGVFVPGTPWVATGSLDGTLRIWDYRTGLAIRPPLALGGSVMGIEFNRANDTFVVSGHFSGHIVIADRGSWLPQPELNAEAMLHLAELDAHAEVHDGGGLVPLTTQGWIEKWEAFRKRYPHFSGHRLGDAPH